MSRVPLALQAVFLASNRGQEVHKPPPAQLTRARKWFWQRREPTHTNAKSAATAATAAPNAPASPKRQSRRQSRREAAAAAKELKAAATKLPLVQEKTSQSTAASPVVDIYVPVAATVGTVASGGGGVGSSNARLANRRQYERPTFDRIDSSTSSVTFQNSPKTQPKPKMTPQVYLEVMLQARGYSTERFPVLSSGYYNKPTPLQQSSHDAYLVSLVKTNNAKKLSAVLAAGISQNPANTFGESLLHMVCRLGSVELLKVMLEAGCDVQISDDYGRTPLHDACWASEPALDVVQLLLQQDPRMLFLVDARGALPLSYIQNQHFSVWIEFLGRHKEAIWPHRPSRDPQEVPPLTQVAPHSRPVPDPDGVLSLDMVRMVASGRLSPEEVAMLQEEDSDEEEEDDEEDFEAHNMRSYSSDYSYSGRVSFGGNTFNFSDSESESDEEETEEDDEEDDLADEPGPVGVIHTTGRVDETLEQNPVYRYKQSPTGSQGDLAETSNSDASAPLASPQKYPATPGSPAPVSPSKVVKKSLSHAEESAILVTPGKSLKKKKVKRRSRGDGHSRASSRGSDSASVHSDVSFQTTNSRSLCRNPSAGSTYPSTESSYQESLKARRMSINTLSSNQSGTFTSKKDLFCLLEDDDGLLAGSC